MVASKTYIATPPGATIKEQLEERCMTQREFAVRMDYSEKFISQLINGRVELTPATASRLEMVLGVPASFWMNLEAIYREKLQKVKEENSLEEDAKLASEFPYTEMVELGWVPDVSDVSEKVFELRKFFEVAHLDLATEGKLAPGISYYQQQSSEESPYILLAQAQKDKIEAREQKRTLPSTP